MPAVKKRKTEEDFDNIDIDDDIDLATGKPKKKNKKNLADKNPKERKSRFGLILFLIFIALMIFLAGVIAFNLFGLRDNQMRGILEKIPIVNNILPPLEAIDPVAEMSTDELLLEIEKLKAENESLQNEVENVRSVNSSYTKELERLRQIEATQEEFRANKEAFDRDIALGNVANYEKYYSQISPENAENIYREVVGIVNADKQWKNFVSTYENMEASSAASIFESMVRTNLDLVVMVLRDISTDQRAEIMAAMSTSSAEQVTSRMAPVNP